MKRTVDIDKWKSNLSDCSEIKECSDLLKSVKITTWNVNK